MKSSSFLNGNNAKLSFQNILGHAELKHKSYVHEKHLALQKHQPQSQENIEPEESMKDLKCRKEIESLQVGRARKKKHFPTKAETAVGSRKASYQSASKSSSTVKQKPKAIGPS